jgi:iron complex outermembrane recepter protein
MAFLTPHHAFTPVAAAALLATSLAWAQQPAPATPAPAPTAQLEPVNVTARAEPPASVAGWGDTPLSKVPIQASVFGTAQLRDLGATRLSDLVGVDPAVSDAYNSEGYWDIIAIRGFVLDNRFNFRRDGLPINAETSIALDNKSEVQFLKGISGMQAGTSAPGGLVNYVVKRPTDAPLRSVFLEWEQPGSVTGSVDLSQRFGEGQAFGVRVNAAAAHLDPMINDSRGDRSLFALAADWRIGTDTLLEAEVERSHRSQPSQPGFSMLGDAIPAPGDPRLSLNNQPWSLPVVFDGTTASLRWQQRLADGWRFVAHAATQQLRTDDRLAFPFGCSDPNGTYYADRFCPDGSYDLYDYRSENERRRLDAVDLALHGAFKTGAIGHALTFGAMQSRVSHRFERQAYNYVGTGNVDGSAVTPADPSLQYESTNRDERSTELYLRDAIAVTERLTTWLGLRHTRLQRDSVRTDGSQPTSYAEPFTTPWVAASYAFAPNQMVYASWGRGVESTAVPNLPAVYTNAGAALTSTSRQAEIGLKGASDALAWSLAWFDIQRPQAADFCDAAGSCSSQLDGTAHHRGIDATAAWHQGGWTLRGGTQWLQAQREGSATAANNGREPVNLPALVLSLQAAYDVAALPGLNLQAAYTRQGSRMVLPDNSASIPAYNRLDAAIRYGTKLAGTQTTWRVGVENLLDERAWRESPYQFNHVYLYPLAPRTLRLSLQVDI